MTEKRIRIAAEVVKLLLIGLAVGLLLTFLSLLVPVRVENALAVADMRFGKPFAFLFQSFLRPVNEEFFPCRVIPKFTDGYQTLLSPGMFCASWGINSLIGIGIVVLLRFVRKKKKRSEPEPEVR